MSLYRHVRPLLELTSVHGDDHVGRTWLILPSDGDQTPDHAMDLRVWVQPAAAPIPPALPPSPCPPVRPTVGKPVLAVQPVVEAERPVQVVVETSVDKASWAPAHPPIRIGEEVVLTRTLILAPYVRVRTVGNGSPHAASVYLLANGAFRLERV